MLTKYPEISDSKIGGEIGVSRHTVSRLRRDFVQNNLIRKINLPDLKKLGFEIMTFYHIKFDPSNPPDIETDDIELLMNDSSIFMASRMFEAFMLSVSSGGKGLFLLLAGNPGPSEYVEELKREMPENGLLVANDIPDADIPVWMSALDAAVFAFEDIWVSGSVLLALSYERPAIVPQVGFLDEYVDYESTGLLYRHGDLDAMAQAMSAMVGSPYKAHFEYMCRANEKKNRLPLIANLYQKMYEDVIRPE